ncbi:glyoxylase-like metal-dependent hydrolase (beta-lactamase superfamily II) [Palleronia aestuarii]|uniref:Glyoxylase-like metal-dependent hydrolase (Beta-lactamase superfamily II) n=1 Tax=Palleronia aestuarii TaxID=568105 RepID=A0A2W7N4F3_9RHOB|nr:MBL fold metallo-hydrolase [Palleronia aestuarii]PZX15225.1 glyoxylase-like metal-dependent hydrolase (beta-lactamase superfamily II) [Palleronia aestuarii]
MTKTLLRDAQRHYVNDIRVTALSDGPLPLGYDNLLGLEESEYGRILHDRHRDPETFRAGLNAFLIETDGVKVLVDSGCGGAMGPETGRVPNNLAATGVTPEEIDVIYCTHMHGDHIGGLIAQGGEAVFPKAALRVHEDDVAHFSDEANATDTTRKVLEAYGDRMETFTGQAQIAPGLTARPLPGHTPGHSGLHVSSGSESLLIWTDIVHIAPIQLARPEIGVGFDVDPDAAQETRKAILEEVATDRQLIAGSHIGFPGIGWIAREMEGYRFEPVPYTHDRSGD